MSKLFLGALSAVGLAASAQAAMTVPSVDRSPAVTLVAEGCGPGFWRGPGGHRHPFAVNRLCLRGRRIGPEGRRCWPN
ncbi:MAG: hypothetical protein ABR878_07180 [Roseiarcus sp.]|jgi:opacity protein-like surface antigen